MNVSSEVKQPFQLFPLFRERVWGRESLAPLFPDVSGKERIGEVWFTFEQNPTSLEKTLAEVIRTNPEILGSARDDAHPDICPLLVKLLFTSERLSVQVHPDDEYAGRHHNSLGKTEAWYVVDAQPPGEVAVGFREALSPERFRASIESGEVEDLLDWRKVKRGDAILAPAGTVHAIGAGLTICEVQENSDITYRLYDYGRPRELHLNHGMAVSKLDRHELIFDPVPVGKNRTELAVSEYFRMERLMPEGPLRVESGLKQFLFLLCLAGEGTIAGQQATAGSAWMTPAGNDGFELLAPGSQWILAYKADDALESII
ncbi:MAG: class I mannose-6-phosphate isomerase [Acidobacteriaceae bacterium]|nr:class I mannose-6-phosphate isomerase [Acidobacteriaceae bacterium]